jgi:hypothetical protein
LDERFVMSDWMKQRDLLIEETLAFSQRVTADTKVVKPTAVVPKTYEQKPVTATLTEKPDMERAAIQRRVMNFKAHQDRFQREREEYYATTMAKARATQWNSAGDKKGLMVPTGRAACSLRETTFDGLMQRLVSAALHGHARCPGGLQFH